MPDTEVTMNCTPNAITSAPNTRFMRTSIEKLLSSLLKRVNVSSVMRLFTAPYVYWHFPIKDHESKIHTLPSQGNGTWNQRSENRGFIHKLPFLCDKPGNSS